MLEILVQVLLRVGSMDWKPSYFRNVTMLCELNVKYNLCCAGERGLGYQPLKSEFNSRQGCPWKHDFGNVA